jgi:high-affinity nickel-transport protein
MVDTSDGALMMALYTSKAFARDQVAILYYSIVLTGITVFVSAFIGIIQVLSLAQNIAEPEGSFWDGVSAIGDNFDVIGGSICGLFVIVGLGSVAVYRPWRRRMDRVVPGAEVVPTTDPDDGRMVRSDPITSAPTKTHVDITTARATKSTST